VVPAFGVDLALHDPGEPPAGAWPWLFLTNVLTSVAGHFPQGSVGVSWSLSVEEQFYLLWPAIVLMCSRRTLTRLCLGMIVFAPVLRLVLVVAGVAPVAIYVLTPTRMDTLAVGATIALHARSGVRLANWRVPARRATLVALVLLVVVGWASGGLSHLLPAVQVVGYSAAAAFSGSLLVLALAPPSSSRAARILSHPLLRTFGRYSYALYLVQIIVRDVLVKFVFIDGRRPMIFGSVLPLEIAFTLTGIALSFAIAWLSWRIIERPLLELKRFFVYGGHPATPTNELIPAPSAV
jgi:peptidoglycan/LPS O-acetylase OafA/YrhL